MNSHTYTALRWIMYDFTLYMTAKINQLDFDSLKYARVMHKILGEHDGSWPPGFLDLGKVDWFHIWIYFDGHSASHND